MLSSGVIDARGSIQLWWCGGSIESITRADQFKAERRLVSKAKGKTYLIHNSWNPDRRSKHASGVASVHGSSSCGGYRIHLFSAFFIGTREVWHLVPCPEKCNEAPIATDVGDRIHRPHLVPQ